jgi:hypothetical protein
MRLTAPAHPRESACELLIDHAVGDDGRLARAVLERGFV